MNHHKPIDRTRAVGRREVLACAASMGGAALAALCGVVSNPARGSPAGGRKRPNILWILAEDMSPHFNVYGEKVSTTPWVDRLASEGAIFMNAFVTAPVCSPSRSAMITGMYQTTIGAHHHRSSRGPVKIHLPKGVRTLPEIFREQGYYVTNGSAPLPPDRTYTVGKTDYNFEFPKDLYDGTEWSGRKPGQPFFAQVQLRGGKFRRPRIWFDQARAPKLVNPDAVRLPPYYPDDPVMRKDWAEYLDSVNYVDQDVGYILGRLEREGELDNTVVFFWTDHGIAHARGKQFLYEEGIRVPLIVRAPDRVEKGSIRRDLVAHIDIAATSLEFAGIPLPGHLESRPLFGPKAKPREYVVTARDRCDETVDRIRSARTDRYKYIRNYYPGRPLLQPCSYKDGKEIVQRLRQLHEEGKLNEIQERVLFSPTRPREEMYDLQQDRWELNDLAGDTGHQKKLAELRGILEGWIKQSGDKGETPEREDAYDGEMQVFFAELGDARRKITLQNIETMKRWAREGK